MKVRKGDRLKCTSSSGGAYRGEVWHVDATTPSFAFLTDPNFPGKELRFEFHMLDSLFVKILNFRTGDEVELVQNHAFYKAGARGKVVQVGTEIVVEMFDGDKSWFDEDSASRLLTILPRDRQASIPKALRQWYNDTEKYVSKRSD